jgi:hypothetical protein
MRYVALALALGLYAAGPAFAQNVENLPLVGWLRINTPANNEPGATLLRDALAALGLVDGRDIVSISVSPMVMPNVYRNSPKYWSGRTRASSLLPASTLSGRYSLRRVRSRSSPTMTIFSPRV